MSSRKRASGICLVGLCVLGAVADVNADEVLAFPGVEGAGRFATGGRGGEVVHVTNLDAKGPGSLAEAVSGPDRIVVFDVSGVIQLAREKDGELRSGKLAIEHPNITIAGQTAPGEGICLTGGSLDISASNVIVRYLRSRRGWVAYEDSGDAIEVKPLVTGTLEEAAGESDKSFQNRVEKKAERGKTVHGFAELSNIVIDHCSTSWATDENLTVTHADKLTCSWSIAAEGCDYENPKQTPMRHSEGSLWGSSAPDGRSTMHHMLYAHNRLRNPRTTGGDDVPAVLNLYNSVIYNWSEYPTHTGSERVLLNLLNNYYKPGPSTPKEIRRTMFEFHGDLEARIFVSGNIVDRDEAATADNRLAIGFNSKFKDVNIGDRAAMISSTAWPDAPPHPQTAAEAYEAVLADVGATLPARDPVDLRIVTSVRNGKGKIIDKETDLPKRDRKLDYRSLPPLPDADEDGLPDFWEQQFGLDRTDPDDARRISHGYANIEHYFNNTSPSGADRPIVCVSADVSRTPGWGGGAWRVTRRGDLSKSLQVFYSIETDAVPDRDYTPPSGKVTFLPGINSATIELISAPKPRHESVVVLSLIGEKTPEYDVGCPARSLIVIEK